jgi:hypothetical protein
MEKRVKISREFLETEYRDKLLSLETIARNLGCSPTTVRNRLVDHGIEVRQQGLTADIDLTDQRNGKLVAKSVRNGKIGKYNYRIWLCQCDCGNTHEVTTGNFYHTLSCGCLPNLGPLKHGHNRVGRTSKTYRAWSHMLSRCRNPDDGSYKNYGGRTDADGRLIPVTVCDRWIDFENFLDDIGEAPFPDWELDRIDPEGNYEVGNVRWAPAIVQTMNKRVHLPILESAFGIDWATRLIHIDRANRVSEIHSSHDYQSVKNL